MAQHTIDCACVADTYVDKINPNTNYGSATALKINNYDAVANGGYGNSRALLKFDTPSSILRKRILSVILSIHITTGSDTHTVYVRSFKLSWEENTVTFNTALNMIDNYVLMPDNSIIYPNQWSNIPLLLEIVQQRLEDILNYGLEVFCTFESGYGAEAFIDSRSVSGYEPKLTIVYEDVPPDAPTPIDPVGTYKDSNQAIRFQWRYNSSVGGTQKAFELQWSTDQSTWTTISQTTANTYYDMPAGTFPVDNIYWRVKCYNELDEASPYSNMASFYAVGAPAAPVINTVPTNSARPVVSWSAFNQQIYQLQVLQGDKIIYDSGNQPGIYIRQHKVTTFLPDGTYTIKLRIKNEYDMWSAWGETAVTIATVKPAKPTLTLTKTAYGFEAWTNALDADYNLLYRDNICIAKAAPGDILRDNSCVSGREYQYILRAVKDDAYMDSNMRIATNLIHNGNFANGTEGWSANGSVLSVNANIMSVTGNGTFQDVNMYQNTSIPFTAGKKYYIRAKIKVINASCANAVIHAYTLSLGSFVSAIASKTNPVQNTEYVLSNVYTMTTSTSNLCIALRHYYADAATAAGKVMEVQNVIVIDLTATFGAGNEPAKEQCDSLFSEWFDGSKQLSNSSPVLAAAELKYSLIAPVSDLSNVFAFTRALNAPPKRSFNRTFGGTSVYYAGRKNPVWEPDEHVSFGLSLGFFLRTWAEVEKFIALYDRNETVLYRDAKGRKIYGTLSNLAVEEVRQGYTVSFTISQVDYNEEVEV